ncbi:MAG: glycosyltransferase [Candidatus Taylorbacteria bacterium]|nr:glycosyltransferase [Candidatus Taylorbacteria bacterium]
MQKKKKILLVITKSNWGGAQRYVYDLAVNIPKRHLAIEVALGGRGLLAKKLEAKGIKVHYLTALERDVSPTQECRLLYQLIKLFRAERPDLIHLNSSKAGFTGAVIGRLCGVKKIIFTAHGWAFNENRPLFQRLILRLLHWLTVMLSTKTVTVSDATAGDMAWMPWTRKRLIVIKNGLRPGKFRERREARTTLASLHPLLREKLEAERGAFLVGTLAELHVNKGLESGIRGFKEFLDKHHKNYCAYLILGEGEERKPLESLIAEEKLESKVFLLGFVENAPELLKAFDVFLLPSRTEAFPYSLLEAGAAGLPTVGSDVGGIPEIISDMESGILVRRGRSADFGRALSFLSANRQARTNFGENLKAKVARDFNLSASVADTAALYNSLLNFVS